MGARRDKGDGSIYQRKSDGLWLAEMAHGKKPNGKPNGNISEPRNVDRMFRNILEQCKIETCGVHSLRHTFASMLFKKGADVKIVSELLGHSDVSITYNTYIHLIQKQKRETVNLLNDL